MWHNEQMGKQDANKKSKTPLWARVVGYVGRDLSGPSNQDQGVKKSGCDVVVVWAKSIGDLA